MDIDKLHSEYRSTYRWHEYTPRQQQVVSRPPQPLHGAVMSAGGIDGSDFSRRKKHPDLAYRAHQIFDKQPTNGSEETERGRPGRSLARSTGQTGSRRSKSEGPVSSRGPQSEYRQQFVPCTATSTPRRTHSHQHRREEASVEVALGQAQEPKMNVSFPPPAPSSGWNRRQNSLRAREMSEAREPKKSISMGQIQPTGNTPASETKVGRKPEDVNGNSDATDGGANQPSQTPSPATKIKEYKSEYKQKFRPFSQYEYIGDGKFYNTSSSPPNEVDNPTVRWPKQKPAKQENLSGEPWYQEVIELRKAATDYKCRGWGTDLVPPHMSQIYNQQMTLAEQASTRKSLSALALAISTPRSQNKDEKERKTSSPSKPRSSRPRTAPLSGPRKSTSRSESARPGSSPAKEANKDKTDAKEAKTTTAGRSVSAGSPARKESGSRPHSAKRQRPNSEAKEKLEPKKGGISRNSSKAASRDPSRPPSAIDNHIDYFREPVVKSPPEPTRVKSPEQLHMRSPDPINWTVPLDTRNTFSVTQSVRDSDSARNSPMSDHSSHFDSVSGTAINLGMHSVNEKGSLHYPKVSALAREAKELQGKTSQKKDEVKEEKKTSSTEGPAPPFSPRGEEKSFGGENETKPIAAGQNSENGHSAAVNGTTNGTNGEQTNGDSTIIKPNDVANKETAKMKDEEMKPSSNLKCLEDPNFSFDEAPSHPQPASTNPTANLAVSESKGSTEAAGVAGKKPSYRVLEDPDVNVPKPKTTGYKVLEDPMMTSIYEPVKPDPAKGRPEEVADGARQQFDKFFKGNQS